MRQFRVAEIARDIDVMVETGIVDHELGKRILDHVKGYMEAKQASTIRLTTLCALILEAFQIYDTFS